MWILHTHALEQALLIWSCLDGKCSRCWWFNQMQFHEQMRTSNDDDHWNTIITFDRLCLLFSSAHGVCACANNCTDYAIEYSLANWACHGSRPHRVVTDGRLSIWRHQLVYTLFQMIFFCVCRSNAVRSNEAENTTFLRRPMNNNNNNKWMFRNS